MSSLLEQLKAAGCDMDGTMGRFLNDEEFYEDCYKQMFTDANFEMLGKSLEAGDTKQAFEYAHALKGVIANMGITPLYDLIVQIVEPLRAESGENLTEVYQKFMSKKEEFQNLA